MNTVTYNEGALAALDDFMKQAAGWEVLSPEDPGPNWDPGAKFNAEYKQYRRAAARAARKAGAHAGISGLTGMSKALAEDMGITAATRAGREAALRRSFNLMIPSLGLSGLGAIATPIVAGMAAPEGKGWRAAGGATLGGLLGSTGGGVLGGLGGMALSKHISPSAIASLGALLGGTGGAFAGYNLATR